MITSCLTIFRHPKEATSIPDVPPAAQAFLREHIESIWQLEVLIHLRNSSTACTSGEIAKALYMSEDVIQRVLIKFEKHGLIKGNKQKPESYNFSPAPEDLNRAAEETFRSYYLQRVQVANIIYAPPLQDFAEAFRLRKEDQQ